MSKFADNLRFLRERKELKQADMLDAIGFRQTTWANYEGDVSMPKHNDLEKISNFFEVLESDLLHTNISEGNIDQVRHRYNITKLQVNTPPLSAGFDAFSAKKSTVTPSHKGPHASKNASNSHALSPKNSKKSVHDPHASVFVEEAPGEYGKRTVKHSFSNDNGIELPKFIYTLDELKELAKIDATKPIPTFLMNLPEYIHCVPKQIHTNSLEAMIPKESFVFLKKIEGWKKFLEKGRLYYIELHDRRELFYRIDNSEQPDKLYLVPLNPALEPLLIAVELIDSIFLIKGYLPPPIA